MFYVCGVEILYKMCIMLGSGLDCCVCNLFIGLGEWVGFM